MCIVKNCFNLSGYNYNNNKIPIFCKTHKLPSMVYINRKKCIFDNCKSLPHFNYSNESIGLYCSKHKLDGMINVKNITKIKLCKNGLCYNDAKLFFNFYCKNCYIQLFPNSNISIDYKTIEVSNILIDIPNIISNQN
jgi:hypothetical protein